MSLDFPNSPTPGQNFTAAGDTWKWDGAKWEANSTASAYTGPPGPTGPQGPTGAQGPQGIPGSSSYQAGSGIAINTGTTPATISTAVPYLPLTGGTLSGNVTAPTFIGALTGQASLNLPLTGGTLSNGLHFGSALAPSGATDTTRHLTLYDTGYGLSITSGTLNIVSGGVAIASLTSSLLTVTGGLTVTGTVTAGTLTGHASLDLPLTGGTVTGNLAVSGSTAANGWFSTGLNTTALPSGTAAFAISWNRTGGGGETDFWNTYQSASGYQSFLFYQVTSGPTATLVGSLGLSGLNLPGQLVVGTAITCNGGIAANGANAIVQFQDRSLAFTWGWYGTSSIARLWNNLDGDRAVIDRSGNMGLLGGTLSFGGYRTGLSSGAGPILYGDPNWIVAMPGSGNLGFMVYNSSGSSVHQLKANGDAQHNNSIIVNGLQLYNNGGWWWTGSPIHTDSNFQAAQVSAGGHNIYDSGGWEYHDASIHAAGLYSRGDVWCAGHIQSGSNFIAPNGNGLYGIDTGGTARLLINIWTNNFIYIGDNARQIVATNSIMPGTDNSWWLGSNTVANWYNIWAYGYGTASDLRFKTDIEDLPDCLDLVRAIAPRRYRLRDAPKGEDTRVHWGWIAQDVGAAMRAAGHDFGGHTVGDDKEKTEGLYVNELTAVLWKACQEMAERISTLEARLDRLH